MQDGRAPEAKPTPGVCAALGELKPGATISEWALAKFMGKHVVSIKRAVARGELPPPVRLSGKKVWTVGSITRHIEKRLEKASKEAEREAKYLDSLNP